MMFCCHWQGYQSLCLMRIPHAPLARRLFVIDRHRWPKTENEDLRNEHPRRLVTDTRNPDPAYEPALNVLYSDLEHFDQVKRD